MIKENSINARIEVMKDIKSKDIEIRRCIICEKATESCLSENEINGIIINGEYICRACEREIITTNIEEEKYDNYKEKMKIVIYK